jgi:hypothetical protein
MKEYEEEEDANRTKQIPEDPYIIVEGGVGHMRDVCKHTSKQHSDEVRRCVEFWPTGIVVE